MRKNKKIIKCDKKIVTCDVRTAQREDETIKCDVLITQYSRFDVGQGRTTNSDLENQGRSGRDWVLKNSGQVLVRSRLENNRDYRVSKGDKDQQGFEMKTKAKIKI